jgi:hypothetical protein
MFMFIDVRATLARIGLNLAGAKCTTLMPGPGSIPDDLRG